MIEIMIKNQLEANLLKIRIKKNKCNMDKWKIKINLFKFLIKKFKILNILVIFVKGLIKSFKIKIIEICIFIMLVLCF